ncbi:MAG: hypothetical protein HY520_02770 [Candidatus Aenigmarchaeota archaeon]|nr:hypothetical protein [Candidatus Aenigmarchaeota archaeon]
MPDKYINPGPHISYIRYDGKGVKDMDGCCGTRSFLTREEKVKMLEEYKDELDKESQGVAERIRELKQRAN